MGLRLQLFRGRRRGWRAESGGSRGRGRRSQRPGHFGELRVSPGGGRSGAGPPPAERGKPGGERRRRRRWLRRGRQLCCSGNCVLGLRGGGPPARGAGARGPGAPGGKGLGPDFCHLRGCRKLGLARRARNPATLNPRGPRMLLRSLSCLLPSGPVWGRGPCHPTRCGMRAVPARAGGDQGFIPRLPGPWASRVCVPSAGLARARGLQRPDGPPS